MQREAADTLVARVVEAVAEAQVEAHRRGLRVAGLLHPDEARALELLEAADLGPGD
jgi:hypothetical protein